MADLLDEAIVPTKDVYKHYKGLWDTFMRKAESDLPAAMDFPGMGVAGAAVLPLMGMLGTIGRVGAGTKTPVARFLKRVLERSMKGFQGPAAAKPVVGEVLKKAAPVHKQLPMPSYQEIWRAEYLKALKEVGK